MKKIFFISALMLVVVQGFYWLACAETLPAAQVQQQAAMSYRAGRYQESAQLYKKLADLQPNDPDTLKDLMWALWNAGQTDDAMRVASKITSLNPSDTDALNMLARAQQKAGRADDAIADYRKILKQKPGDAQAKVALAQLYQTQGNLREAEALLTQASKESPGIREIYPVLAKTQNLQEEYKSAAESWQKAAQHATDKNGDYKFQQAKALYQAKETEPAAALFNELLQDKHQKRRALDMLVSDALANGRLDTAVKLLETNVTSYEDGDENRLLRLARLYGDTGQIKKSLKALDRLLDEDPDQIQAIMLKGNYLFDYLRNYADAITLFQKAAQQMPENPKIYPKLATAAYLQGSYDDSARAWAKAFELSPTRNDFKLKQAEALYFGKHYDEAIKLLYSLLDDPDQKLHALDFLLGDFVARGDLPGAAALLERYPMNGERLFELGTVYRDLGKTQKSLAVVDKYIGAHPDDASAYILKAQCLATLNKNKLLLKLYEQLQKKNPTSTFYLVRLAEAQYNVGRKQDALKTLQQARKLDPTDPNLLLRETHYRYDIGEYEIARKMLTDWLQKNKEPDVAVLIYHGLTPTSRDPMLMHPYHMTTTVFEDQMRALKQAGFSPVTVSEIQAWIKGDTHFPKRPLLITFDDGREDSFKNADPILKAQGLKATMFTIANNAERNLPNYANWDELIDWKNTGRWDIQAHGDLSHTHITVNAAGDKAFFLTRKMWLDDKKREETDDEWRQRVLADHQSVKEKLSQQTGMAPIAFAFPEGNYAQFNVTGFPLPQDNIDLIKKVFTFAFHEDEYGMNIQSKDPGLFARYMPGQNQKGTDLARFLTDQTPFALARKTLLQWALWEEKPREAFDWLAELKKGGASDYCLLMEEARIHTALNDLATAEKLLDQASHLDNATPNPAPLPLINPSNIEGHSQTNADGDPGRE